MKTILITGGTGTLGREVLAQLAGRDAEIRVFSRRAGPGRVTGDLTSGAGLAEAARDCDAIVHLASDGRNDRAQTRSLIEAAKAAGRPHLIYVSIVGVDKNPFFYYRQKLECERLVEASGLPFTILRATQFHTLVVRGLAGQRRLPVLIAPKIPLQPIAPAEVATRLVELIDAGPSGRVADIGGPQVRWFRDLAQAWAEHERRQRPIWPLWLPGRAFRAFQRGAQLAPNQKHGTVTFEHFLAETE
jgi:uncharacterized protein YbjT (DUF2867 family)